MTRHKLRPFSLFLLPFIFLIPPILERVGGLHSPRITMGAFLVTAAVCAIVGATLLLLDLNRFKKYGQLHGLQITVIATVVFLYIDIAFGGVRLVDSVLSFGAESPKWHPLLQPGSADRNADEVPGFSEPRRGHRCL